MAYHFREKYYSFWVIAGTIATAAAYLWRRLMLRTTFIAITGSVGKTTAKECLGAILSRLGPTVMTFDTQNGRFFAARSILRVRPWHRFAVIEVAANGPGTISQDARLVSPDVALILAVARSHWSNYRSEEEIAAEKARLLDALRRTGKAILNADDPYVAGMAKRGMHATVTFGTSPGCDVRATEVQSRWPDRLSFRVQRGGESRAVRTQLVGEHWLGVALAALAAAVECGMDLDAAAAA